MGAPSCTEEQFIALWDKLGSPIKVSMATGTNVRNVQTRRRAIEQRHGIKLASWANPSRVEAKQLIQKHTGRVGLEVDNGVVIVFSDAHFEPGVRTTAFRALLTLIRQLKPVAVVCNGDALDFSAISRHARIGWEKRTSVAEEIKTCKERLGEIEEASKGARMIWPLGNHDSRLAARLAAIAPEFEGIENFDLKDHFPEWEPCWAVFVNDDTLIAHRYHNGIHAVYNNIVKGQCNYVTGHLHSLKVTPYTNALGNTLYGVDTGMLGEPLQSTMIDYMESRHGNWRSGFAVLTWRDGKLLMPELVQKYDEDSVEFRGHILNADTGEIV